MSLLDRLRQYYVARADNRLAAQIIETLIGKNMNQLGAFRETIELMREARYDLIEFEIIGVDMAHLESMLARIEANPSDYSEAKLGRWLGYMQGVLVANAAISLEQCKEINKRHSGFVPDVFHPKRGSFYKVLSTTARFNTTHYHPQYTGPKDRDLMTVYVDEKGNMSVRATEEFNDGRFVKL